MATYTVRDVAHLPEVARHNCARAVLERNTGIKTQKRIPNLSAQWFREAARRNTVV